MCKGRADLFDEDISLDEHESRIAGYAQSLRIVERPRNSCGALHRDASIARRLAKIGTADLTVNRPVYNSPSMPAGSSLSTDQGARLLVVEDDANARSALCALLESAGYEVHAAENGVVGLATLEHMDPDLIITDLAMPGVSGFDLVEAVRAKRARHQVPVIVVSASARVPERVRGLDLGADDFIAKPLEFDELLARVRSHLARTKRIRILEQESSTDPLTGILNRRGILDFLALELERIPRGHSSSVVMVDLDGFKGINDTYGHAVGDIVLCAVAGALERTIRKTDRVGRLGGDEFLVVLDGAGTTAENGLSRLRGLTPLVATVSPTLSLELHLSFGFASALVSDSVTTLLERADRDMYLDKRR
jgi:diguanylate cyclase (GGDEF)-like protein